MQKVLRTSIPVGLNIATTRARVPGEDAVRGVSLERRSSRKAQARVWEATVEMAAPATPQPAPNMSSGARSTLTAFEARVARSVVRIS